MCLCVCVCVFVRACVRITNVSAPCAAPSSGALKVIVANFTRRHVTPHLLAIFDPGPGRYKSTSWRRPTGCRISCRKLATNS